MTQNYFCYKAKSQNVEFIPVPFRKTSSQSKAPNLKPSITTDWLTDWGRCWGMLSHLKIFKLQKYLIYVAKCFRRARFLWRVNSIKMKVQRQLLSCSLEVTALGGLGSDRKFQVSSLQDLRACFILDDVLPPSVVALFSSWSTSSNWKLFSEVQFEKVLGIGKFKFNEVCSRRRIGWAQTLYKSN